ncbi:hypothetical protein [Hymenobacter guriensis]|uniref:Uncharacterized protein n=1 Tax=Hymenobacter guriensis TaxID=2793065 RepID=A0ABS0L3G6_9BACT|nr:hypothetical protein [Hymenobacter guriensis]MBG8554637.1 hypothetical protein [Hymenobacter guriensis]
MSFVSLAPVAAQAGDQVVELPCPLASVRTAVRSRVITRDLSQSLHLTQAQQVRMRVLYLTMVARQDELQWHYGGDPEQLRLQSQALDTYYEQECRKILRPAQVEQLLQASYPASGEPATISEDSRG